MKTESPWFKICPRCGKNQYYRHKGDLMEAIKKNTSCNRCNLSSVERRLKLSKSCSGWKQSEEVKKQISISKIGKPRSEETKRRIGLKSKGRKHSDETKAKIKLANQGKRRSEEFKREHRSIVLRRFNELGIPPGEDEGAKEWFEKYNKETNSNFQPRRFLNIGYDADGYDKNKHIWIEYDTKYHQKSSQKMRDLIRQNNIIKYYESIGEPLVEFCRVVAYNNEEIEVVYRGVLLNI